VNEKPTDQEMTAAAEAIIDRVAALRPDHDYETNGLVWAVAGYAVGLQSIIDEERDELDRLRAVVEIANRVVDRRDPEQWSVDHNAFAELGAALEQLDAGPTGEDT
jgi:hypothetical protein